MKVHLSFKQKQKKFSLTFIHKRCLCAQAQRVLSIPSFMSAVWFSNIIVKCVSVVDEFGEISVFWARY